MKKYILTKKNGCTISALLQQDQLIQIDLEPNREQEAFIGDIFIGKIKDIVPNIQAAFIEIANGQKAYLSLDKLKQPIFLNPKKNQIPHQGDELLVQVFKEASKAKPMDVTANINITGRFAVLTHGKTAIGVSGKIGEETKRKRLYHLLESYQNEEYGFIIRTSAENALESDILTEIELLIDRYYSIRKKAEYSSCFSCISRAPSRFMTDLQGMGELPEIITDCQELYEQLLSYLSEFQQEIKNKLRFYEDSSISLWNLFGMESKLEKALKKKVWLPCGAYLIIEPTEALTVIDVNSGKAVSKKKDKEQAYYKINLEAAKEIAVQIRLRNLSGIILVDFIDMKYTEHTKDLICQFTDRLNQDPVKTNFIDITALHLAEITRKKVRKPLSEQFLEYQDKKEEKENKKS